MITGSRDAALTAICTAVGMSAPPLYEAQVLLHGVVEGPPTREAGWRGRRQARTGQDRRRRLVREELH